jgi:uncharacterized protein (DUF2267 family)
MKTNPENTKTGNNNDDYYQRRHGNSHYAGYDNVFTRDSKDEKERFATKFREPSTRKSNRATNFERYVADGNHFINQVAIRLRVSRHLAAQVSKAVLHAVRDRLPANDAVQFAQGLPMIIKGIYFDQYDLARVPVVIRHPEDFIDYVYSCAGTSVARNFPDREFVEEAVAAVFNVLEQTMDYGQVAQIRKMLNDELGYLLA